MPNLNREGKYTDVAPLGKWVTLQKKIIAKDDI